MGIIKTPRQPRSLKSKAAVLPYVSVVVREERIKLGLKQIELADKVGIGLKTLRKIEQGNLNINYDKFNDLLNCLSFYLRPTELASSPSKKFKISHSKVFFQFLKLNIKSQSSLSLEATLMIFRKLTLILISLLILKKRLILKQKGKFK